MALITGKNSVANKLLLYGEFGYNLRIFPFELFFGRLMVVIRLARGGAKKASFLSDRCSRFTQPS